MKTHLGLPKSEDQPKGQAAGPEDPLDVFAKTGQEGRHRDLPSMAKTTPLRAQRSGRSRAFR